MEDHVIWDENEDMPMLPSGRAGMSYTGQLDQVPKETKQAPTTITFTNLFSNASPDHLQERRDKTNRTELP
jgi:hypothetical protein